MKRASFLAIVMILGTALGFGNDYIVKIESMKNRGDIQGLQAEYDRLSSLKNRDALTECALGETTAFLLVCREERDGQKPENNTYALESVGYLRAGLALDRLEDADIADAAYTLSLMYNRLIRDAASWMKYNAEKEKYIRVCLEKNPAHVGAQLVSALSLMNLPKSAGGDPDKGRSELDALRTEHPDHLGILTETGALLLQENKYDAAEKVYSRIFALYPDYPPARKILEELSVMKMALPIQDIRITGMLKTSKARILRKVASAIGTKYSMQTKMDIESRIMEIKSITGCQIEAVPNVADTVSLNISISENNMYMLGALGSLSLSRDYEGDLNPGGFPAMIYMDQNIFGTADSLNIIFAGVYVNLDYFKAGVIDDKYPDIKFHWDSMFLDSPSVPIEDGKPLKDLAVKSPKHQVSISIGKDFPVGLSAFVGARLKAENWTKNKTNKDPSFTVPSHHFTINPFITLSFSTTGSGMGSKMDILEGFAVQANPELLWVPSYKEWGAADKLYTHNSVPAVRFNTGFDYYKKLFETQNLRINTLFMTGSNLYEGEKWSIGKGSMTGPGACLDGYYNGEFSFTTGAASSLTYQITVLPARLALYGKYDIFMNLDDNAVYQGTALGVVAKLPFDIELAAQLGIGLNAERENGPGYEADLSLMKLWFY